MTERSPSSRRAWIEISTSEMRSPVAIVALLAEGVDRNSCGSVGLGLPVLSPSSRRAWIEIAAARLALACPSVALLAEGVDRNLGIPLNQKRTLEVALLAEGVDRNSRSARQQRTRPGVALLAEGVDRNLYEKLLDRELIVALLAEGVDRNQIKDGATQKVRESPSSRRAWIEIENLSIQTYLPSRPPRGGRG